ncbi:hypothetical protein [Ruegeria sp. HKCCSP351]|uniref:hypothetical protein n=1 Tax=Ruegeria sp. HKCCSP351 TaxID=2794832 RepID=UPI001AE149A4|nr:hypothetical protein [Ruegeria sp. HKCCSP351]
MVDMRDDGEIADMSEVCHVPRISGFFKAVKVENDSNLNLSKETIEAWQLNASESVLRDVLRRNAVRSVPAATSIATRLADKKNVQRLRAFLCAYLNLLVSAVGAPEAHALVPLKPRRDEFDRVAKEESGEFDFRFGVLRETVSGLTGERELNSCSRASINRLNSYFRGAAGADGELRGDATRLLHRAVKDDFSAEDPFVLKLWSEENPFASWRANRLMTIITHEFGTDWFREWYSGFLVGRPLDWDQQLRVAQIDDAVWNIGPRAVADAIERIRARFQVEKALADLGRSLTVQTSARHGIGGNNPPESIEDERLSGAITLIWEATEELSTALEEERPARERIEAILGKFKSGLAGFLKWCAGKGDLAVDTLIKWGIPATGAGYAAKYPEKIEALIKAIEDWLPFLS